MRTKGEHFEPENIQLGKIMFLNHQNRPNQAMTIVREPRGNCHHAQYSVVRRTPGSVKRD